MTRNLHRAPVRGMLAHAVGLALALTAAGGLLLHAPAAAQQADASARIHHDIPAGDLGQTLTRYAGQLGLTLSFAPEIVAGRRSTGLSGEFSAEEGFAMLLAGTGIAYRFEDNRTVRLYASAGTPASDAGTIETAPLSVEGGVPAGTLPRYVLAFGGESIADSGTTVVSGGDYQARIEGNGDANSFLRGMANVQYQNDVSEDAGVDGQREIDMRPLEVSISGGKIYENNFRINGVGVNNLTGRVERSPLASSPCGVDPMPDYCSAGPDFAMIYGLHSQTVYVPDAFVESVAIIDSNASARYGDFQGGVVDYKLVDPSADRISGTFSYDHSDSDWVQYQLSADNTYDRKKPDYRTDRYALSVNLPVTNDWAVSLSYSQQDAYSRKQRDVQYRDDSLIDDEGRNRYYRLASNLDTDYGKFTVDASYTDYENSYLAVGFADSVFDVKTHGLTSQLRHEIDFDGLQWQAVGLGNVKLTSRLFYNDSYAYNASNADDVYTPYVGQTVMLNGALETWESEDLADICRHVVTATNGIGSTVCRYGGFGEREQGQTELGFSSEAHGELLGGTFGAGLGFNHAEAQRARTRDSYYYSTYRTIFSANNSIYDLDEFICDADDLSCSAEQYATTGVWHPAFDVNASLDMSNAWLEWDRRFGKWALRTGLRMDYESYFKNFNVSPRVVLSWTPSESLALSAGFNRYYDSATLIYAIRDQQPSQVVLTRSVDMNTGVVSGDWSPLTQRKMSYKAAGLDTPFVDEVTASLQWNEPWLDGNLRLRWMQRKSKDQFATVEESSSIRHLTNDGRGEYQSATLEYLKSWEGLRFSDRIGLSLSATWSKNSTSGDTYFDDDGQTEPEDFIWYRGRAYTLATFQEVTGNLDIPIRTALTLDSDWFGGRLNLATSISYNLPYDGVQDTQEDITVDDQSYNVYEDVRLSSTTIAGLSGTWRVWDRGTSGLQLNFRINNLFNDMGNGLATAQTPWKRGRSFWAGLSLRF